MYLIFCRLYLILLQLLIVASGVGDTVEVLRSPGPAWEVLTGRLPYVGHTPRMAVLNNEIMLYSGKQEKTGNIVCI